VEVRFVRSLVDGLGRIERTRSDLVHPGRGGGSGTAGANIVADVCGLGQFIGVVKGGEFVILDPPSPAGKTARLTRISIQAARSPESDEIDLAGYEGRTIMVCGQEDSGWIYSAKIVDQAGPIITALVEKVFGQE
jgi:hypothetical protein